MRIGIDLGGTKIEAILMDSEGVIRRRQRVDTPQGDYRATLAVMAALVDELERGLPAPARVGIGTPGALSPASGRLRNANSTCLNGQPFLQDCEALLGREIRIANDANCFALSEAIDGAAAGARVVFGVIIGTGTGGGVVIDGQVLGGHNAIAGEWGHNPLPWPTADELPGRHCYCGQRGCVETWLSGPGLAADHREQGGEPLAAHEIAGRAGEDLACSASLDRHAERLAKSLASVINLIDPEVIVLGGGLSQLSSLYEEVPRRWGRYVFSDVVRTRLLPPLHGDASGVRGAAWLWPASD